MGALVTLELPDGSPMLEQPWIITFGPLTDAEEWEPVVCGPYERPHALALAEAVVADEQLMAVVEPLVTAVSADEIRGEIAAARAAAEDEVAEQDDADLYGDYEDADPDTEPPGTERAAYREPAVPPGEGEIRAGFARIAELLIGGGRRPD
ncbi:hypothetical protein ACFFWC_17060 [Plantactinospora siamensis]|uniref:Uncharacterized protein n=1 Tax=Plantactinospora siamensis TaxID=555372 RepID=A0ABV6NWB9_9ACTN